MQSPDDHRRGRDVSQAKELLFLRLKEQRRSRGHPPIRPRDFIFLILRDTVAAMSNTEPFSALIHLFPDVPSAPGRTLFLGAVPSPAMAGFPRERTVIIQYQKSLFDPLLAQGFDVRAEIPDDADFDNLVMLVGKQQEETRHDLACGLRLLKAGGTLTISGANDGGGKRIEKDLMALGLSFFADSKHKCRVAQARKNTHPDPSLTDRWIADGAWQPVLDDRFVSRPGLFSWDRIDKGSALLAGYLPQDLVGRGADFGCGYGYLATHVLGFCSAVSSMICVDADARAVEACRRNIPAKAEYLWHDLTKVPAGCSDLDFIIMNPPFHEGSVTQNQLGVSFIRTAAACLKKNAHLYMVANTHLPYEAVLSESFRHVYPLAQQQGFKIFRAIK